MLKRIIGAVCIWVFALLSSITSFAQEMPEAEKVHMAEGLRSSGKIYVVVAVLLTVVTGMVLYMVRIDKKISRLEKRQL